VEGPPQALGQAFLPILHLLLLLMLRFLHLLLLGPNHLSHCPPKIQLARRMRKKMKRGKAQFENHCFWLCKLQLTNGGSLATAPALSNCDG